MTEDIVKAKSLGYFSMDLSPQSVEVINDFCNKNNIPAHKKGLHTTVFYDENAGDKLKTTLILEEKLLNKTPIPATITGIKVLGKNNDGLVLLISCDKHAEYFKRLYEDGYKHSYDDYTPHMSILYNATPEEIKTYSERLKKLIGTKIYFNNIKVEFIEEDWAED